MSEVDIAKLSQRLRAAINKVGADEWQVKQTGELIVKGSYERNYGYSSYTPVAEDVASEELKKYMVAASPANVLVLLDRIKELECSVPLSTQNTTSIPNLIKHYGSMKACSIETGISEMCVAKHRFDHKMEHHIIIDGRLYVHRKRSKQIPDLK